MNYSRNSGWFTPEFEHKCISNVGLHDSEFVRVDVKKAGAMELRFYPAAGRVVSVGICKEAEPIIICFSSIIPTTVAMASIRTVSENVADFFGVLMEADLVIVNRYLKGCEPPYVWLLIIEPNLGGVSVIAGKGRYESMIFCAVADDASQLPSIDDLPSAPISLEGL